MDPVILLIPDIWTGNFSFTGVHTLLEMSGYDPRIAHLPSTTTLKKPNDKTMDDDIAAIRAIIEELVGLKKEVLMVCHGAGGFLGTSAIKGLTTKDRENGGVSKIVFIAADLYIETDTPKAPWWGYVRVRFPEL